jgi:trimeric autotransporter adhesin
MNHIYRSIWNEKTGTFVAVSENTKTGGKKASTGASVVVEAGFALKALAVSLMLAFGSNSYALPANGTVVAGSATITGSSNNMTISQSSQNAALNWQSFNIGTGEAVHFVQPNSSSVALNRVLGADPSSILGTLSANGKVFIVNPNGILFGKGASVNVGGLVASTRNISDSDFMAGNYKFDGTGNGSVLNQGTINADGGYVALLGASVSNEGTINARLGTVALAAGNAITLDVAGDGLLNVAVDQGSVNALVQNGGMIQADGGQVLLTAQAAGTLLQTVVNNTGIIQAQTIENHNGTIKLLGDMQSGTVNVGGKLDASAPNGGNGGAIETSAAHVKVQDNARITTAATQGLTGSWLIDPTDFTIAAAGGDMTGATLTTSLAGGNVAILSTNGGSGSAGDVNVNDSVTWSANKLTLNAQNNININTAMNGSGTASLALQYGQGAVAAGNTSTININAPVNLPSGNTLSITQGSDGAVANYAVITSLGAAGSTTATDLQGMKGNLGLNYALGSNIDASATSGWNAGAGFAPVGNSSTQFTGVFNGLGHTITSLTINRPNSGNSGLGLFGQVSAAGKLSDIGLIGGSVTGTNSNYVGELVGLSNGKINNSYATGTATGASVVGGLMGINYGTVSNSHANGAVTATGDNAGGLSAYNFGTISNSYATGAVAAGNYFSGGLVGTNMATVTNSYATGAVTGNHTAGGLVAFNQFGSNISTSYAAGVVTGTNSVGGLVGHNNSTITNSYWNSTISGSTGVGGGTTTGATGLTTVQMQTASNFTGFTFTTTTGATGNNWVMVDVDGTLNNTGGALGGTRPMLASEYSTTINNAHQLQLMSMNLAGKYTIGQNIDAAATGMTSDVWSGSTFIPVGNASGKFTGTFNGQAHTISNLTVNQPTTQYAGLFGWTNGSTISNIGLVGGSVSGKDFVGGLVGLNDASSISNSYNTGTVAGTGNCVGGLVGANGDNLYSTIDNSYATGNVTGNGSNFYVGGLVGVQQHGVISNSYATGNMINGGDTVGGLVGFLHSSSINNSYSTGSVAGTATLGGFVGYNIGSVATSYWNTTANGGLAGAGASSSTTGMTGLTATQMKTASAFSSFDFGNTWVIYDTYTNPLLRSFMTALTVTANNATKTYDSVAYSGGNGVTYSVTPGGNLLGSLSYSGSAQGAVNAGSYAITPGGLYSNQQGYLINYVNSALTVNAANLTLSTSNVSKTYDGGLTAAGTATVTSGTLFGSDSLSGGTFAFTNKNVGSGNKIVTTSGVTVNDGNSGGNYNVSYANNTTSSISQANLTLASSNVSKTYDGGLSAAGTATVTSGTLFGSDSINGGTFAFTDKNVGSGNKTVTTSGVTVSDGNSGGNYNVSYANNTNSTITRLNSVTWIGGVNGNWFDPANWAGGAVPDLSNVANVVIPTGVTVSFNSGSVVSPAQAGTVNVDSIGGAGGMSLVGGNLSVVSSLQLASLDQSGGTFNSTGNVSVDNFNQTGGSATNTGSFTATNSFSQSGGTLGAGGNVSITQASGSVTLGNLSAGGSLDVTAVSGDITQAAGTSIVSGGTSTMAAPIGNVTLDANGNSFGATIVSGSSVTKIETAVATAISTTSVDSITAPVNSSGDNLVSPLVSSSEGGSGVIGAIGVVDVANATGATGVVGVTPMQTMLAGLNVTITGPGVNLPVGVQVNNGNTDDKN